MGTIDNWSIESFSELHVNSIFVNFGLLLWLELMDILHSVSNGDSLFLSSVVRDQGLFQLYCQRVETTIYQGFVMQPWHSLVQLAVL